MASVRDIARRTGLSPATVSRALNAHPDVSEATRSKVVDEARRTGYLNDVNRSSQTEVGTSIGYVVPGNPRLWEYDWMLMDGILQGLRESRFDLQVVDLQRGKLEDESYTQFFRRRGLRGVIIRTVTQYRSVCEAILSEGFPSVVVADRFSGDSHVNYVCCDSTCESTKAIDHLLDLGHHRIALVIHRRADQDHLDRQRGYITALQQRNIKPDDDIILRVTADLDGGKTALNRLISLPEPPTAIHFTDPLPAVGAMCRAHELGLKIPDDLSIVGFDDSTVRNRVVPTMTAVCQDTHELGMEAAMWLGRRLTGIEEPSLQLVLPARLEINQTTGVPPKNPVRLQPSGTAINCVL